MQEPALKVVLDGRTHRVPRGTQIATLVPEIRPGTVRSPLAALYNHRIVSLSYPMRSGGEIQLVTMADRAGWDVYRRSASMMLYEAARRYHAALRLVLHQTHGDALYYDIEGLAADGDRGPVTAVGRERCQALAGLMRQLCREDLTIEVRRVSVEEARDLLREQGNEDKVFLLRTHWETSVQLVVCGGFVDLFHGPMVASTGQVRSFRIQPYAEGLLLRVPVRGSARVQGRAAVGRKVFETHRESRAWCRQLGVANLGQLNALCISGRIEHLIRVAEGGHEKQLARIADQIATARRRVRVVLVAGPSASGKTTFAKRLTVQLLVNGVRPRALSVDDFFVPRGRTPRDAEGNYDFESLAALDLRLFNQVLRDLLEKGQARVPRYDFHAGRANRRDEWETLRLAPDQVLLIEGIHALNPRLTPAVAARQKFGVYVSALTQLSIDDHNRIFTSDTRLLRRIVRDRRYRGYSATETLARWPSVRRGEMRHIFPFQERADAMFNSALVYEHAVLRNYVERYLLEVDERAAEFPEAYRLLGFLRRIVPILPDAVPQNSLLREFIGDSAFHY